MGDTEIEMVTYETCRFESYYFPLKFKNYESKF